MYCGTELKPKEKSIKNQKTKDHRQTLRKNFIFAKSKIFFWKYNFLDVYSWAKINLRH